MMFTWSDVPQKASSGSGQGHGSSEEDGQDEVGEQGREPDHLERKEEIYKFNRFLLSKTGLLVYNRNFPISDVTHG